MHKRINILFFIVLCIAFSPCPSDRVRAEPPAAPSAFDSLQKEKELLARRTQLAQMESEIIAYQRKQLDIEMRSIAKLTKDVAAKERQLQIQQAQHKELTAAQGSKQQYVRDSLKQKLDQQSSLLAQARMQVEQERRNLDLRVENLKIELARQELERKNFLSKAAQEDAQRKEQRRMGKAESLHKDLQSCQQSLSQKEYEQKERERLQDAQRRQSSASAAEHKRLLLQQQQDMSRIIQEEKKSGAGQSLQARLDSLLEKQQKLLNISRKVEQDLRRQKEDVQFLLDHSRAEALKGETK